MKKILFKALPNRTPEKMDSNVEFKCMECRQLFWSSQLDSHAKNAHGSLNWEVSTHNMGETIDYTTDKEGVLDGRIESNPIISDAAGNRLDLGETLAEFEQQEWDAAAVEAGDDPLEVYPRLLANGGTGEQVRLPQGDDRGPGSDGTTAHVPEGTVPGVRNDAERTDSSESGEESDDGGSRTSIDVGPQGNR